ncbi:MAG TPA: nucleoside triphosphate pyrophosphohydrolase [Candidatus Limnocylindria bacterium]|nr:nucleoside triphosphate pyrophosphohydrolase [Candidatus Limnocylindria bacterium]
MDFIPSNLPIENEYPKLVRDRIPELIEKQGKTLQTRILEDDEYLKYLLIKMIEESTELLHSLEKGNMQEELADVFEIIYAILKVKGWTIEQIIEVQKEKREKNGGFEKKILMLKRLESK